MAESRSILRAVAQVWPPVAALLFRRFIYTAATKAYERAMH
jgi:hypothetical protein